MPIAEPSQSKLMQLAVPVNNIADACSLSGRSVAHIEPMAPLRLLVAMFLTLSHLGVDAYHSSSRRTLTGTTWTNTLKSQSTEPASLAAAHGAVALDMSYVHRKSLEEQPPATATSNLCPPQFSRHHHRHSKGAPRASIAVFASCPYVCHFNTAMVELTLSSFMKHLHIPAGTDVYVAHTPGGTPGCTAYEAMLRRWAEAQNSCYFISKSMPDAYLKIIEMTHDPYLLLLEHDWYLVPIKHTLADLIRAMDSDPSINQIRFNQQGFNEVLDGPGIDITRAGVPLAMTPHHWSNNPSLTRTDFLRHRLSLMIDPSEGGSAGIEQPWLKRFGSKFDDTVIAWFTAGLALYGHSAQSPHKYILHLNTKATSCDLDAAVREQLPVAAAP